LQNRTVTVAGIDRLHAEFNANALSGCVESGYRFVAPWIGVGITPYVAGQFTDFELPAYAEQALLGGNSFALAYDKKNVTDTRSELGIRTDRLFAAAAFESEFSDVTRSYAGKGVVRYTW